MPTSATSTIPMRERSSRTGFTLLEVLGVTVILAMAALAFGVGLRGPIKRAMLHAEAERFATLDQRLRREARAVGRPITLRLDLERRRVVFAGGGLPGATHASPGPFEFRLLDSETQVNSIDYLVDGTSVDFIATFGRPSGPSCCLVVSGLSGQATIVREGERPRNEGVMP